MTPEPLVVRLSGRVVGELLPDGVFRWLLEEVGEVPFNAPALSHSLPFAAPPRDPAPFFGGLLPEGAGLQRLVREAGVTSNALYELLAEVGADVGGSVTVGEPRPPLEPIELAEEGYERILERAYGYLRGSAVGGGGSSTAGVQPKLSLTLDQQTEKWLIGRGSTPSTHLLKPVPKPNSATIHAEAFMNLLALDLGLSGHQAWVESAGDRDVLIIERYDRARIDGGGITRIHQEDAAQALGLPWGGNDKYENVNPRASLGQLAKLLDRGTSLFATGPSDRERLLALVTLNVVAGNTDAHAKNFSLMLPELDRGAKGVWNARLAEAYDIVPQSLFEAEQSPLAMRIGGMSQPDAVTAEHLISEAGEWGISTADAERVVVETFAALKSSVTKSEPGAAGSRLPRYLLERIENLQRGDRVWTRALPPALSF